MRIRAFRPPNQSEGALNIYSSRLARPDLRIQPQDCLYSLAYADDMPSFFFSFNDISILSLSISLGGWLGWEMGNQSVPALRLDSAATGAQSKEEAGARENGNQYQSERTPHSDGELEK